MEKFLKKLFFYLHFIGIFIFFYIIFKTNWHSFFSKIKHANLSLIIFLGLWVTFLEIFRILRMKKLLELENFKISFKNMFFIYIGSIFWGNITPGRAGEFYKIKYLKIPKKKAFIIIAADRGFDFIFMVIFAVLSYAYIKKDVFYLYLTLFLSILVFLLLFLIKKFGKKYEFTDNLLKKTGTDGILYNWNLKNAFLFVLYTILSNFIYYIWQFLLLNYALNVKIPFFTIILMTNMISLANVIPVSFSGIGTREGIAYYFFKQFNYSYSDVLIYGLASLFYLFIVYGTYSLIIWFYYEKKVLKNM